MRYVRLQSNLDEGCHPPYVPLQVLERLPVDIGLVFPDGAKIYRQPETIGFHAFEAETCS
jgi:hypothetical protein